jgi:hypothetical protein
MRPDLLIAHDMADNTTVISYAELIAIARKRVMWLIHELKIERSMSTPPPGRSSHEGTKTRRGRRNGNGF